MRAQTVVSICAGILALTLPFVGYAQSIPTDPFSITLTPTYPRPNEQVTLTIGNGSVDLSNATFTVFVNKKKISEGTGTSNVSFMTGAAGSTMNIHILLTSNGKKYEKDLTTHPESVALVVEPRATVPLLYRGGATVPPGGSVRVVAVSSFYTSSGAPIDPATLSYVWKDGNQTLLNYSGINRTSVLIQSPLPYRQNTISVLVQNQDGTLLASRSVSLAQQDPLVRIYRNDPLMGIEYNKALYGKQTLSGVEGSFVAVPYGFSIDNGLPSIKWSLNGASAQNGATITLRPQGSGKGTADLFVSVNNPSVFESAGAGFTALFGSVSRSGFGLFGL